MRRKVLLYIHEHYVPIPPTVVGNFHGSLNSSELSNLSIGTYCHVRINVIYAQRLFLLVAIEILT